MSKTIKRLILLVVIVGAGFVVYIFFVKDSSVVSTIITPTEETPVGVDVLSLVDKLRGLSIDSSLFTSLMFVNLKDLSAPVTPEAQGRLNPFAPIGGGN